MLSGLVPLPFDALAGVYYPWAGQFWGYVAGIPYKNIAVTDVFSQLYPWRALAMDIFRSGHLPLWNQYSFSGFPLLANWQSAPFYPLNLLMLVFGNIWGFSFMVFLQPLLSMIFLYLFLKQIKVSSFGSFIGAITFAFSGFSLTYLEYATSGQIFIWLPLALLFLEKYLTSLKKLYLGLFSLCFFPILTGGFFQPAFYVILIIFLYTIFRVFNAELIKNKFQKVFLLGIFGLLGIGTASLQLLPTAELLTLSIRNLDHNIAEYHYGLLPPSNLITFVAPDFFGNPVTQNFWGFMQYQETSGYFSLVVLVLTLSALFFSKKSWREKLFLSLFLVSLILAFDNPLSRSIYNLKVPLISTGYASRWLMVTTFSAAVLASLAYDRLTKKTYFLSTSLVFGITMLTYLVLSRGWLPTTISPEHQAIALRNLLLPLALAFSLTTLSLFYKYQKLFTLALTCLLIFDLLRFGIKFTPFSRTEYISKTQPTFDFLHSNLGQFRVAAESGPILPANTWIYQRLSSPTGYDPLVFKDYGTFFAGLNVGTSSAKTPGTEIVNSSYTRYLNIVNYRSRLIDLVGTKYFLGLKTKEGRIETDGKYDNGSFPESKYQKVFEDGKVVVLENKTVLPRVKLYYLSDEANNAEEAINKLATGYDFYHRILVNQRSPQNFIFSPLDKVKIDSYLPNQVVITATTQAGAYLFLSDVLYPGWKVSVNGQEKNLLKTFGVFKGVKLPAGESSITFYYQPQSFKVGLIVSLISLSLILIYLKHGS